MTGPNVSVPPALAGTDGTRHKEDGRLAPGIAINLPAHHLRSNAWCAMRVARRLVHRYGFAEARTRAVRQKAKHLREVNGVRHITHPFRWLYWDLVAIDTGKIPEPARFALERAS